MRTINHPGVEINEIDVGQVTPAIAGTTCLVAGFADRGEENEPFQFTSRNAFLNYFGQPTNEAEYYFYYAANEIIQQNGGLYAARIPYNSTTSDKFRTQTFTAGSVVEFGAVPLSAVFDSLSAEGVSGYVEITDTNTTSLSTTSAIDAFRTGTKPAAEKIVVVNKLRDTLKKTSTDKEHGGIFTTIVTPFNAFANQNLATFETTSAPFDGWNCLSGISTNDGTALSAEGAIYATPITTDFAKTSIAKQLGQSFPPISYDDLGNIDNYYLHQVMIVVAKTFEDNSDGNKTGVQVLESFVGSLNAAAIDSSTGESIFIDDIVNNNSDYVELYSNVSTNLPADGYMYKYSNGSGNLLSFTAAETAKNIDYADITGGLTTIFEKTSNIDETVIDIVIDAGVSTIAQLTPATSEYDPTRFVTSAHTISARSSVDLWRAICNEYLEHSKDTRKDCITIIDAPRNLVLQGNEKIERPSAPTQLIDIDVMPKLKYVSGLNTSYGTGNLMWDKVVNEFTGQPTWVPPSIKTAGVMIFTDRIANYWDAPAGLNRGILYGVSDIAFNPKAGQMDQMYTKAWNYARNYPLDGIVLEGQRTLQVKPSPFDRVNVRRLFLRLERAAYQTLRYFMYEPNNYFTRTQIIDVLTPIFEDAKVRGGLYDYRIICSEKNNTPEVIDRNELKISIMLKPVKTAEFILVDFYALRTGASFSEIIL